MIAVSTEPVKVKPRESLSASLIACGAFTLAIVHLAQDYPLLWGVVALVVLYYLLTQGSFKVKLSRQKVLGIIAVLAVPMVILLTETPSHAVLLLGAQNFLSGWLSSPSGGDSQDYANFINLVMNTVRAVYLIMLAAAGWEAYQEHKSKEEMSAYVRIMGGSLFAVFMIDAITPYIVGTTATTTAYLSPLGLS